MPNNFLISATKQFEYYQLLAEKTIDQLSEEQLFWKYNEESNSVATIVQHIVGNQLSRWTDFLSTDGEKEWRNRDAEFEEVVRTKEKLISQWNEGWACLFKALASINEENFNSIVYIRNQGHTITDVINRQLAHYPYHIGQIVFIGKMVLDKNWKSLSIPKGKSKLYNAEKFSKPKSKEHFTDEYLKKQ